MHTVRLSKPLEKFGKSGYKPNFDLTADPALPFRSTSDLKFVKSEQIQSEKKHVEVEHVPQVNLLNYLQKQKEISITPSKAVYHAPVSLTTSQTKPFSSLQHYLHSNHATYEKR